jgi:hypothetical protein
MKTPFLLLLATAALAAAQTTQTIRPVQHTNGRVVSPIILDITRGGTGATNAAGARANLDFSNQVIEAGTAYGWLTNASGGGTTTNASLLTTGTLPDARLSTNVAIISNLGSLATLDFSEVTQRGFVPISKGDGTAMLSDYPLPASTLFDRYDLSSWKVALYYDSDAGGWWIDEPSNFTTALGLPSWATTTNPVTARGDIGLGGFQSPSGWAQLLDGGGQVMVDTEDVVNVYREIAFQGSAAGEARTNTRGNLGFSHNLTDLWAATNATGFQSALWTNGLILPTSTNNTVAGSLYRATNTLRYRDSTNGERLILNTQDNLANLTSLPTARGNLQLGISNDVSFNTITLQNYAAGSPRFLHLAAGGLVTRVSTPGTGTAGLQVWTGFEMTNWTLASVITNGFNAGGVIPTGAAAAGDPIVANGTGGHAVVASRTQVSRLTNDVTRTSASDHNASSNNVTGWSVNLDANSIYAFRWNILATCGTEGVNVLAVNSLTNTNGIVTQSIGRTWRPNFTGSDVYVAGFGGGQQGGNLLQSGAGYSSATTGGNFAGLGQIRTGPSNSVLNIRFCQVTASNVTTTLHSNSIIQVDKIWP